MFNTNWGDMFQRAMREDTLYALHLVEFNQPKAQVVKFIQEHEIDLGMFWSVLHNMGATIL